LRGEVIIPGGLNDVMLQALLPKNSLSVVALYNVLMARRLIE
jgi:hypothetical protein